MQPQPSSTPYSAYLAVRAAGTPVGQLTTMLANARRHGQRGAARSLATQAAAPTALVSVLRTPEGKYVGLVRLRLDQAFASPYALERGCAVLLVGADALPEGWQEFA